MNSKVLWLSLLFSLGVFCAQTFVVQKQELPKKQSRSRLKERACHALYDVLNGSAEMLHSLSQTQKTVLGWLSDFIAADKKNVIDAATDAELKALIEKLEDIVKQYEEIQNKALLLVSSVSKK